ncbi:bromodomain-containing protein 8-like [Penaeus monodon]|uniref:bromodomain-containing protein 8-like n=1 Tax=Penaeus monodon TaxID=6687 RepID=UPI0018A7D5F2|nr:bromodomain-containing protein 8-like [Penaeus monodon]
MSKKLVIKLDIRPKTQEIPSNLCSFELLVKNTKTALHYSFELGKRVVFRYSSWIIVFCLIFFRDWVSEVERIFVRSTKRKVSGGDFAGSSSPLITESAPNSPASTHYGDDPEHERSYRSWKKPIMILWNEIAAHKFASLFLRPITDDQAPGYHSVVYRPMDLQTIKRNIESGVIRNTAEFQRDMMLMFLNAKMYNTSDHNVYHMAHQMMKDTVSTIEEFLNTQMLARAEETPQKSLRRETRESSAKRSDDDPKRKSRDSLDEKGLKKRRL